MNDGGRIPFYTTECFLFSCQKKSLSTWIQTSKFAEEFVLCLNIGG